MRYYPYPPYYPYYGSYYPQPYSKQAKFPLPSKINPAGIALILVGILLVGYGLFFSSFKLDPKIEKIAKYSPDQKIYALVFCNGVCTGIDGEKISADRVIVHMKASELMALSNSEFVKQIIFISAS